MKELIIVRPDKCVGCGSCVRSCPSPEANVSRVISDGRIITTVNGDKCIGCGECIRACPHRARDYLDDAEECMNRSAKGEKMVIVVSPVIMTALPTQWKGILDWFKNNGSYIYDISYGTDICLWAHSRLMGTERVGNIITQSCGAVVRYAEIYQPKMLKNLVPIHSPISCQVTYVKNYLRRTNPVAVLSPCIAMKSECIETGLIDYNVTFKKILAYFDRNGIRIPQNDPDDYYYEYHDVQGMGTDIYPTVNGFGAALTEHVSENERVYCDGVPKVFDQLNIYANTAEAKHPNIFDAYACESGCSLGPGIVSRQTSFDIAAMKKAISASPEKTSRVSGYRGGYQKLFKTFDNELQLSDFTRTYKPVPPTPVPMMNQLNEAFEKMGKETDNDKNINCGLCGFNTCREMAAAIARGQNVPENCIFGRKSGGGDPAKEFELNRKNKQLSDIADESLFLTEKINENISLINEKITALGDQTSLSGEKASNVKKLLGNVVKFCEDSPIMGPDEIGKLVAVLNNTIKAFGPMDDSISAAFENSDAAKTTIDDISQLMGNLVATLKKSEASRVSD